MHRFPIYSQGQALATISIDSHATGTASEWGVGAVAKIAEAHVELNDVKQKKLGPLQRPADIVLMDGARPANAAEAKRLAAWTGAPAIEKGVGSGPPPRPPRRPSKSGWPSTRPATSGSMARTPRCWAGWSPRSCRRRWPGRFLSTS
jgi:hypothetical protein